MQDSFYHPSTASMIPTATIAAVRPAVWFRKQAKMATRKIPTAKNETAPGFWRPANDHTL